MKRGGPRRVLRETSRHRIAGTTWLLIVPRYVCGLLAPEFRRPSIWKLNEAGAITGEGMDFATREQAITWLASEEVGVVA